MSIQYGGDKITFADSSVLGSAWTGFKNRIINGAMNVWQRGTSFASGITTTTYTADRFFVYAGGASVAVAQVSGPTGYTYALRVTGAASNTSTAIYQRIEANNCADLSGASVTIQANISTSASVSVSWVLQYAPSSDNWSTSPTTISSGTWSTTSTPTVFSATVNSLPSGALNGLQLIISPNNLGAFTSGTITVTGVQLEKGSTATSFDYRPYGTELALCQRYYEIVQFQGWSRAADAIILGSGGYVQQKRAAPTVAYSKISGNGSGSVTAAIAANIYYATCYQTGASSSGDCRYQALADAEL